MSLVWHFDFHTPGHVRVGENCDFEGMGDALAKARVRTAIYFAKCHFGFSYYPTRIGTPHPRLAKDVFGGLVEASRKRGIKAEAYVSFGIDGAGGEKRPEWRRVYPDGSSDPAGWFINVCPFTSYVDERVLPQIEELFHLYRPDGYWFDTMSALSPCYCRQCRVDFQRDFGEELPFSEGDPRQAQAGQWRHDRGFALVTKVADFIHGLDENAAVGFNQLGSLPYPEPMPAGVTVLTLDPDTTGPQSIPFSLNAAYGSSAGQPCEIMPTIFHGGWGDWSPASSVRIETSALACWMRAATCIPGDRLHPEGRLTQISQAALRIVAAIRSTWEACAPAVGAQLSPDIVILHSPSLTSGADNRLFAVGDPRTRLTPINGMHRLLLDSGANFTVAGEWQLDRVLPFVKLVIVPEVPALGLETEQRLQNFVREGGAVLLTGRLPQVDGRTLSFGGIVVGDEIWQDHAYLPPLCDGGPEVLVRGPIHEIGLSGAETVLPWVPAYDAKPGSRYGWGIGPSSRQSSEVPALTRQNWAGGAIWFFNGPIACDYAQMGNWPQTEWMASLLERMVPEVQAHLFESEGNLELVVWRDPDSTWLYLLDHQAEQLIGEGRHWARGTRSSSPRKFTIELLKLSEESELHFLHGGRATVTSTATHLTVKGEFEPPFAALRIDWKSAPEKI